MAEIKDVITAMTTPFGDDGAVDYGYVWRHLRLQEENGISGVVPCGTNGEGQSLSMVERKEIIRFMVENKGGMFVLAGTGCASLPETIELTRFAEQVGADGALVLPPYFYKPTSTGLRDYYRRIFDAVEIPIMLYNIPKFTGIEMTHDLIRDLSDYPHLFGVKDSTGDMAITSGYVREFPKLKVFSGFDTLVRDSLKSGAQGAISGASNVFPGLVAKVCSEYRAGQPVDDLQDRLSAVALVLGKYPPFAVNKTSLTFLGFPVTHVRPPLVDLTPEETATLLHDLRETGSLD